MPRDGSNVYSLPSGSVATDGTTILATTHNTPLADIVTDLNAARPVTAGGTGATSAGAARTNLGAVGLTGDETIAGAKTFSGTVIVPDASAATHALNRQTGDARYAVTSGYRLEQLHAEADTSGTAVAFTTNFASTDREIIFDLHGVTHNSVSDRVLQMSLSTDGGSNYTMSTYHSYNAVTSGTFASASASSATISLTPAHGRANGATVFGAVFGRIKITQNHADTTIITFSWDLSLVDGGGGNPITQIRGSGYVATASGTEIDAVRFNWSDAAEFQSWGVIRHLSVSS